MILFIYFYAQRSHTNFVSFSSFAFFLVSINYIVVFFVLFCSCFIPFCSNSCLFLNFNITSFDHKSKFIAIISIVFTQFYSAILFRLSTQQRYTTCIRLSISFRLPTFPMNPLEHRSGVQTKKNNRFKTTHVSINQH